MILFSSMWLLLNIATSLTFNGYKIYDVWDGKVIMPNPNSCACFIVFRVTWLPCPSKTNKCWLVKTIPLGINFLKKAKNSLNKKKVIQTDAPPSSLMDSIVNPKVKTIEEE